MQLSNGRFTIDATIADVINYFFWSKFGFPCNPFDGLYNRDRKGRFSKEPKVIKYYPVKRNLYNE